MKGSKQSRFSRYMPVDGATRSFLLTVSEWAGPVQIRYREARVELMLTKRVGWQVICKAYRCTTQVKKGKTRDKRQETREQESELS